MPHIFNNQFVATTPKLGHSGTHAFRNQERIIIHAKTRRIEELKG